MFHRLGAQQQFYRSSPQHTASLKVLVYHLVSHVQKEDIRQYAVQGIARYIPHTMVQIHTLVC